MLSGEITLQSVDAIHAKLLDMAAQPVVEIDCSDVTEADLSLVQLILAARASAQKSRRILALAQPAAGALLDALQRGGFLSVAGAKPSPEQGFWMQAVT
jgi:ABC-type transporter Mla MlaB component